MKKLGPILGVVAFLLIIVGIGSCQYNSLVNAEEDVDGSWAQVENVLQRRADLIPNLVETVKGFAAQEKEIFSNIAEARSRLIGAKGPQEASAANGALDSALGRLLMVSENYPQLRSSENFQKLQDELAGTENRIAVERKRYNDNVREYNKAIRRFPKSLFAGMLGFDQKDYFEAEAGAEKVPTVKFSEE